LVREEVTAQVVDGQIVARDAGLHKVTREVIDRHLAGEEIVAGAADFVDELVELILVYYGLDLFQGEVQVLGNVFHRFVLLEAAGNG
jgi:hypothetical protein